MSTRTKVQSQSQTRRRLSAGERRERIRAGAMEVFAERGYESASMVDIASAAAVTPAVIYDHFPSKAALHNELLEQQTDDLLTAVGAALAAAGDTAGERMRIAAEAFFAFVEENPFAWRMIFRDPPSDPEVAAAHRLINDRATAAIASFIEQGADGGLDHHSDPRETAEVYAEMMKMSQKALATWWYEHREVPREEIVTRLLDFCWIGMRNVASPVSRP